MISKKQTGYQGEDIATDYYLQKGFDLVQKNYTIRGGEIDLIFKDDKNYIFVEVKVINATNDIFEYISKKKLNFVLKTIQYYIYEHEIMQDYRFDAIFIKDRKIFEVYENLEL